MAISMRATEYDVWSLFDVSWDHDEEGLDATLAKVLDRCRIWFKASGASLFLADSEHKEYRLSSTSGAESVPKDAIILTGEGIAGACIEREKPLLVSDPAGHPILAGRKVKHRKDIGSAMVIPLLTNSSGVIGVLNLSRPLNDEIFNKEDLIQAESFGRHIGLAVANARLVNRVNAATAEARGAQSRLQEVIQCLGVAVIVVDAEGKVTNANPQALMLLSTPHGNIDFGDSDGLPGHLHQVLTEAIGGSRNRTQFYDEVADQSWSIVCAPMHGGGATAAIEEVTEHVRATRELGRVNRLAEIGQMTAAIAHEIRNPLTSIRSAANVLKTSPDEAEVLAAIIEEEALKLNELCNEFLEFARPMVLRLQEIRLGDLAKRLSSQMIGQFQENKIEFRLDVCRNEVPFTADPTRIEQVMRNLLLNALQACSQGGEVTLKTTSGQFTVADTGIGMTEDEVQRLFTPFFTTKPQGTGLGLSNVRKIVDAHGGRVVVHSEPGQGSNIEIYLNEEAA